MKTVHFVVPASVEDPAQPSGGNRFDSRVSTGLVALGWSVTAHPVSGPWPWPSESAGAALDTILGAIPDGAVVLLDGLIASAVPELLLPRADRLRLVVLVHMPLGHRPPSGCVDQFRAREEAVLGAVAAVVATSDWTRRRLQELYALTSDRVHVCHPGVDGAELVTGSQAGGELLCVAAVIAEKGHDILVDALATVAELTWRCVCVGTLDREPGFVADVRRRIREHGLDMRVSLPGVRFGDELARSYAAADVMVLASRAETYGMALTEGLARGLPVIATNVGGVPEAVGHDADGIAPGTLTPPDDAIMFGRALRDWLTDAQLRSRLRRGAGERRTTLSGWEVTAAALARVLSGEAETVREAL